MKYVSGALILVTVYLSVSHAWSGFNQSKPEEMRMLTDLGFTRPAVIALSLVSLLVAVLVLIPQTFFWGNLLNATMVLLIMALAIKTGNLKLALIEIPFLLMPLLLIWLGHPFRPSN